ncbi:MAG: FtsX-like permease family protein [Candidatus Hodarchaeales archaeon]|jgi:putative ABC transport system permease protein
MLVQFTKKTIRGIRAHKLQFIALVLVASMGVMVFISFSSLSFGREKTINNLYERLHFTSVNIDLQKQWISEETLLQVVNQEVGIVDREPRIQVPAIINLTDTIERYLYTAGLAIGVKTSELTVNKFHLVNGRVFKTTDEERLVILVDDHYAKAHGIEPNQNLTITINNNQYSCLIAGTVISPEYLLINKPGLQIYTSERKYGIVFFPLSTLKNIMNTDLVNGISIRFSSENEKEVEEKAIMIKSQLESQGDYIVEITLREDIYSHNSMTEAIETGRPAMYIVPLMVFVVAAFGVYMSISRQITSERRQIGIIMALGHSSKTIMLHYLSYALLVGLTGGITGTVFGIAFDQLLSNYMTRFYGFPFEGRVDIVIITLAVFSGIVIVSFGALIPVLSALKMMPAEAIYVDPALDVQSSVSLIEKLIPANKLSVWITVPMRNTFRNKRRTFSTIFAIMISMTLLIALYGMMTSFEKVATLPGENWDYRLFTDMQEQDTISADLGSIEGIETISHALSLPARINVPEDAENNTYFLIGINKQQVVYDLHYRKGDGKEISITIGVADRLGIHEGDSIILSHLKNTSSGWIRVETEVNVSGIIDSIPLDLMIFAPRDLVTSIAGLSDSSVNMVFLTTSGNEVNEITKILLNTPYIIDFDGIEDILDDVKHLIGMSAEFTNLFLVLAMLTTLAIVSLTVSITSIERTSEYATFASLGMRFRQLFMILYVENIIHGLLGVVTGIIVGHVAGMQIIAYLAKEMLGNIRIDYSFDLVQYLVTGVLILSVVAIGELLAFHYYGNLKLPEILNQRVT